MLLRTIVLAVLTLFPVQALCQPGRYDIAYLWDDTLDNVLDYQEKLEEVLDTDAAVHLKIVGRKKGGFGIIYDHNGTALSTAQLMVQHSELLRNAGLHECVAVEDSGYYELFNVSYGLGPNLDSLKQRYSVVYSYLGAEVGKNLVIEQTDNDNYSLVYLRRGDRSSTYRVARKHAKLLRRKHISTAIIAEHNNRIVFGETAHFDDRKMPEEKAPAAEKADIAVLTKSQKTEAAEQPVRVAAAGAPPVEESGPKEQPDAVAAEAGNRVEQTIESFIKGLRQKGRLSSDEKTSWVVYDLTTGKSVVDINANELFQAASMIKPFIALAFFHQVEEGKLIYGPKSRRNMELMIQRSHNGATNWVMRAAGGPAACNEILRSRYPHIFKHTEIVEYIPPGGKTYRNSALPSDYIRFLQALWDNKLPHGQEIRRLMSLPGRDRLYDGTPIPRGTLVYNKTGSTAHLCGDMGILVPRDKDGKRYPYAVVGIIERSSRPANYGDWMLTRGNVIRQVSTLVYEEMKRQYRLL